MFKEGRFGIVELIWLAAIFGGVVALFNILPLRTAINALILSLAILALIWIYIAIDSLSKGSNLRNFSYYLFYCMIFLLIFSVLGFLASMVEIKYVYRDLSLALAYIFLIISAYKLMKIGTEFGFTRQVRDMNEVLKERLRRRKMLKREGKPIKVKISSDY